MIEYGEMQGSPSESWEQESGKFVATRKLKVAWEDRIQLLTELITVPAHNYPHFPAIKATARRGSIEPFQAEQKGSGSIASYAFAILTIVYETPDTGSGFEQPDGSIITERLEPTSEFLTVLAKWFRWGSADGDKLTEEEAPGKLMRGFDYVYSVQNALSIPNAVMTLPGMVNESARQALLFNVPFEPETLLFNPPTVTKSTALDGTSRFGIVYRFTFKPKTWNKFWRAKTGQYESIFLAGGEEYKLYPLGDFSTL